MKLWPMIGASTVALIGGAVAIGYCSYRTASSDADRAYRAVRNHSAPPGKVFDPSEFRGLPEIAQRYFRHAIAPGTPLYSTAEVRMEGTFLLGDKVDAHPYLMTARQVLRPPDQFVWMPVLRSGPIVITGSDALVAGTAWTRFWMEGLIPVANDKSSPDLVQSARFRAAVEGALWLPSSLLPENGVTWTQTGSDTANVTLMRVAPKPITIHLTIDSDGRVREAVGQRWSNANPEKRFRYQPFGGTIIGEGTFQGLTIPTEVKVGNQYMTADYLPFFQAKLVSVRYE